MAQGGRRSLRAAGRAASCGVQASQLALKAAAWVLSSWRAAWRRTGSCAGVEGDGEAGLGDRQGGADAAEVDAAAAAAAGIIKHVGAVGDPGAQAEGDAGELGGDLAVESATAGVVSGAVATSRGGRSPGRRCRGAGGDLEHLRDHVEHELARARVGAQEVAVGSPSGRKPGGPVRRGAVEEGELDVTLTDLLLDGAEEVEEAVEVARGGDPLGVAEPSRGGRRRAELGDDGLQGVGDGAAGVLVGDEGGGGAAAELPNRNMGGRAA
jgi:hypothetical protein